jgi:hypothetical protein
MCCDGDIPWLNQSIFTVSCSFEIEMTRSETSLNALATLVTAPGNSGICARLAGIGEHDWYETHAMRRLTEQMP